MKIMDDMRKEGFDDPKTNACILIVLREAGGEMGKRKLYKKVKQLCKLSETEINERYRNTYPEGLRNLSLEEIEHVFKEGK